MERLVGKYIFDPEISAGKMVFLTGPRPVGKTTFAKNWLSSEGVEDTYFDWDDPAVRSEYKRNPLLFRNIVNAKFKGRPVPMVFDEIHKQKNWRNILKGVYDPNRERVQLLVTGSARLGIYRKSGDSLVGRYFSFQIFPLGLPEVVSDFSWILEEDRPLVDGESLLEHARKVNNKHGEGALEKLVTFGGFPEPLLKASVRFHQRTVAEYTHLDRVIEEEEFILVMTRKAA